jgi:hypothetical protein
VSEISPMIAASLMVRCYRTGALVRMVKSSRGADHRFSWSALLLSSQMTGLGSPVYIPERRTTGPEGTWIVRCRVDDGDRELCRSPASTARGFNPTHVRTSNATVKMPGPYNMKKCAGQFRELRCSRF